MENQLKLIIAGLVVIILLLTINIYQQQERYNEFRNKLIYIDKDVIEIKRYTESTEAKIEDMRRKQYYK